MLNSRTLRSLLLFTFVYNASAADTNLSISAATTEKSSAQQLDLTLPSTDSKKQKSRMRKTTTKKKKKPSTYREMTYEELLAAKDLHVAQNNYASALKYLDQMIKLCNDVTIIGEHLLEMADLFLMDEQFSRAAQKYAEYVALYPGGEKIEYALFKAIESSFACTLSNDRDQTKTEETLALTEAFLKQDHLNTYTNQVIAIRDKCYNKLAENELIVCSFYLKRNNLKPAEKRLITIRSSWLPKVPTIEPALLILEADLVAQKEALEQKVIKATQLAENTTKKNKHMVERF